MNKWTDSKVQVLLSEYAKVEIHFDTATLTGFCPSCWPCRCKQKKSLKVCSCVVSSSELFVLKILLRESFPLFTCTTFLNILLLRWRVWILLPLKDTEEFCAFQSLTPTNRNTTVILQEVCCLVPVSPKWGCVFCDSKVNLRVWSEQYFLKDWAVKSDRSEVWSELTCSVCLFQSEWFSSRTVGVGGHVGGWGGEGVGLGRGSPGTDWGCVS